MNNSLLKRHLKIGCVSMLAALCALAQDHKWAGRTLDGFESTIHERLAVLPYHGVFNTLNFEVQGQTVILSGEVVNLKTKQDAERAIKQLDGVERVINHIEVLPSSKRDEALRMNVYRAIYGAEPLKKYSDRSAPAIQIIVKNGWVTLEGVVDSNADRSAVHLQVLKVTAHVSDNLRVAPQAS